MSSARVTIQPARRVAGRVVPPGDKSISHRYAMLSALAEGRTTIEGYAPGADCRATLACLRALGVAIEERGDSARPTVIVEGRGLRGLSPSAAPLDARNSGTTMRLMSGVLAAHPFASTLTGDGSLCRRPMGRVIEPLSRMGARIEARDNRPPLTIHGTELEGIAYSTKVPSAQVKSAVLLAGLQTSAATSVTEPAQTRNHTEIALAAYGADVAVGGLTVTVRGLRPLRAFAARVPGDPSSAAFWAVAAAALPGSDVEIAEVGLNPTRTAFLDVLRRAGARVDAIVLGETGGERFGTLRVRHADWRSIELRASDVPALIDELPALAALGLLGGGIEVSGAAELRVKESDRIACLAAGLRNLGGEIEERPDGFRIPGGQALAGGTADAAGDHRLAMAFAVAALGARGPSVITGAESVAVSYPGFFDVLAGLVA